MLPEGTTLRAQWLLGYDNASRMRNAHQKKAIEAAQAREAMAIGQGTTLFYGNDRNDR